MPAYGTDIGLTDYATSTGRTVTGDPAFLRQTASYYIDGTYAYRFKGSAVSMDAEWPRSGVTGVASTSVPDRVDRATYEAALLYDADASALTAGAVSNNGSGAIASEKVDVISVSYHAANSDALSDDTVMDNTPRYDVIENILRPLLKRWNGAGGAAFVV